MAILLVAAASVGCGGGKDSKGGSATGGKRVPVLESPASYKTSARGGTPATGPGERYNRCERIWCLVHRENFYIDHFLTGHVGWIIHDDLLGDIFVPKGRIEGPEFPHAHKSALRLCGSHVHPYILGRSGGPVRDGYYTYSLGYDRAHFRAYGTRLDPCCINGLGSDFIHSTDGRHARFSDLEEYRNHPEIGWQKPYTGGLVGGE